VIDEALLQDDAVFRIGRVAAVEGRRVKVSVDKLKNGSHLLYKGDIVRNVAVGSYVKIVKGFAEMIAKVDGEYIHEDRSASTSYRRSVDGLMRTLDVSLIGFLQDAAFERGIRELPLLDNECFILTQAEFESIHQFVASGDAALPIGVLAMEFTQTVSVGVDAIFASHVGIFGNTGSGKSYTLAKLYHELFKKFENEPGFSQRAQFVLIDFNGEYIDRTALAGQHATAVIAGPPLKKSYSLSTRSNDGDTLPLPRAAVHDPLFWTVLLDATEKTQAPFLSRVLTSEYWDGLLPNPGALLGVIADLVCRATKSSDASIDRQLPINFLEEIQDCLGDAATTELAEAIQDFRDNLNFHAKTSTYFWGPFGSYPKWANNDDWDSLLQPKITTLELDFTSISDIDLVRFKIVLQYYRDIISGHANREHLSPLIKRMNDRVPSIKKLIRVSDDPFSEAPLTVVSLRDVNLAMRKVIPMIVCKQMYDFKKNNDPTGERYLNLIIDEAHNILSTQSTRESEAWRDYRLETFEEIVKEGRKFGVFLTIASQRPHDISETIISQLHNYFLHRLVNNLDIHAIEKAVAYLDTVSFESLPILPTGTCVVAGVSAQVPIVVKIGKLPAEAEPNSRTMSVTGAWLIAPKEADSEGTTPLFGAIDDHLPGDDPWASPPWDDEPPF
jgi:hypothetical protein